MSATDDLTNQPGHDLALGIGNRSRSQGCSPASGSVISLPLNNQDPRQGHADPIPLGAPVYFCNPHSPWQRGSNENTNRLLRFWLEKGSDLSGHTKADLKRIQDTLNRRPLPTLNLDTPAQRLAELLEQAA